MKFISALLLIGASASVFSQSNSYFSLYDNKVYSLRTKGVRDFAVDILSPQLTERVNEQKIFGRVKEVIFKVYWTHSPERLAVDVAGLPDGFIEAKNGLRASIMPLLDNLLPMTVDQRFAGYKITPGKSSKEFLATDPTGLASIRNYVLKFDEQDRLSEVQGMKALGTWSMSWVYDKKAFADGKWVLDQTTTIDTAGTEVVKTTRKLNYGTSNGIGVLSEVVLTVEKQGENGFRHQENIEFHNYRINSGEGTRYFMSDTPASARPVKKP